MFGIQAILLSVAAIVNVAIIGLIYFKKHLSSHSSFFAIGSLALAFWAVSMLYFEVAQDAEAALWALKATYSAALLVALTLYFFSYTFPGGSVPPALHRGVILALVAFLVAFVEYPTTMVREILVSADLKHIELVPAHYFPFAAVLVVLIGLSLGRMWLAYFSSLKGAREIRMQLLVLSAAATVSGTLGLYVGLWLPSPLFNDYRLFWAGPVFVIFLSTAVMYAIFRYRIFNAKAVIGELFVYLLWIFTFTRMIIGGDLKEHVLNAVLFSLALLLGVLLIRSMRSEVAAREKSDELARYLEKANARLKELDREKTAFVSLASHQLRSPITAMQGYVSLLLENSFGAIPKEAETALRKVSGSARAMGIMIEDFLNVSRIELGIMTYDKVDFDLCELVEDAADDFKPLAKAKKVRLSLLCPPKPALLHGDRAKLKQVVTNLVDNALKYTPKGEVSMILAIQDGVAILSVRDTGVGIPKEFIGKLFEKFARAKNANSTSTQGTGLGLFVAKQFVEAHGGTIVADSPGEGGGTTITIRLPLIGRPT